MLFVFFELKKWAIKNDYLKIIILEKNTRALLSMFNPTHQKGKGHSREDNVTLFVL